MPHWTDDLEGEDGAESFVRPYTITHGRTTPERDDLTLITLVTAVAADEDESHGENRGLQPEHRTILDRCRAPSALAEVAADLDLPVSVIKILIGDLIRLGRMTARPPLAVAQGGNAPDTTLLQAVRDGLRRL